MTEGRGGGDVEDVEGVAGCQDRCRAGRQERCKASGMLQEISDIRESSVKANMMDSAKAQHVVAYRESSAKAAPDYIKFANGFSTPLKWDLTTGKVWHCAVYTRIAGR